VSFYTDLVMVNEGEVDQIIMSYMTDAEFQASPHLSLRNIGEVDLWNLWGIIAPERNPALLVHNSEIAVVEYDDGATLIYRMHPDFVRSVAHLSSSDFAAIAAVWVAAQEFRGLLLAIDLQDILQELADFTLEALESGKSVLIINTI
jgi:hypothetical protein